MPSPLRPDTRRLCATAPFEALHKPLCISLWICCSVRASHPQRCRFQFSRHSEAPPVSTKNLCHYPATQTRSALLLTLVIVEPRHRSPHAASSTWILPVNKNSKRYCTPGHKARQSIFQQCDPHRARDILLPKGILPVSLRTRIFDLWRHRTPRVHKSACRPLPCTHNRWGKCTSRRQCRCDKRQGKQRSRHKEDTHEREQHQNRRQLLVPCLLQTNDTEK